jgi:hypothetical protein
VKLNAIKDHKVNADPIFPSLSQPCEAQSRAFDTLFRGPPAHWGFRDMQELPLLGTVWD